MSTPTPFPDSANSPGSLESPERPMWPDADSPAWPNGPIGPYAAASTDGSESSAGHEAHAPGPKPEDAEPLSASAAEDAGAMHGRAAQARELADKWTHSLRTTVRARPWAAVATAMAAGAMLAARLTR